MAHTQLRTLFLLSCQLEFYAGMSMASQPHASSKDYAAASAFVQEHERTVRPLEREAALAWWNANVTGRAEDFKAKEDAQNRLDSVLSDRARFAQFKKIDAAKISDPQLAREIKLLYLLYLEKQVDPKLLKQITAKANAVEKTFNAYRATLGGRTLTDSDVRRILKESRDSAERKAVWEGSKAVGPLVERDLKAVVALRNRAAQRARLWRLSPASASPRRAVARPGSQALRRARRPHARAVLQA